MVFDHRAPRSGLGSSLLSEQWPSELVYVLDLEAQGGECNGLWQMTSFGMMNIELADDEASS